MNKIIITIIITHKVLLRSVRLVVHCIIMRMWFLVDPGARERDLQVSVFMFDDVLQYLVKAPNSGTKASFWKTQFSSLGTFNEYKHVSNLKYNTSF